MIKKVVTRALGIYLNTLALAAPSTAARRGFEIFCRPMRSPITPKQREFFNSAERFDVSFNDSRVQGYKWGSGPRKILFLHGWQSHTYRWKNYIESLPLDEFTVYSLDAPGHGLSDGSFLSVPVYGNLIREVLLELGEVEAVIGHSIGAFSILYTFHCYPLLNVRKAVLMAPPGEATDFLTFYQSTLNLSGRAMRLINDHFTAQYEVSPSFFSSRKFAASMKIPGLIIHDKEDLEAPYAYAEMIHQNWRLSTLQPTQGLGHNLRSDDVVKNVTSFISGTVHHGSQVPLNKA